MSFTAIIIFWSIDLIYLIERIFLIIAVEIPNMADQCYTEYTVLFMCCHENLSLYVT